jgi:ribosome-associated toxin RatA of RatAB toxin-antitoxin module
MYFIEVVRLFALISCACMPSPCHGFGISACFPSRIHHQSIGTITSQSVGFVGKGGFRGTSRRRRSCNADTTMELSRGPEKMEEVTLRSGRVLKLPVLSGRDKLVLKTGKRVQMQERSGNAGSGFVVLDVFAHPDVVYETLSQFKSYPSLIPTVRSAYIYGSNSDGTRAEFSLSRFKLRVNVVHNVNRDDGTIDFSLDRGRQNLVMKQAEGTWFLQAPPDRPEGYCRIWLRADIIASRMIPPLILEYAASRALPRATEWLLTHNWKDNVQFSPKRLPMPDV